MDGGRAGGAAPGQLSRATRAGGRVGARGHALVEGAAQRRAGQAATRVEQAPDVQLMLSMEAPRGGEAHRAKKASGAGVLPAAGTAARQKPSLQPRALSQRAAAPSGTKPAALKKSGPAWTRAVLPLCVMPL
jgi:hypothetical protein